MFLEIEDVLTSAEVAQLRALAAEMVRQNAGARLHTKDCVIGDSDWYLRESAHALTSYEAMSRAGEGGGEAEVVAVRTEGDHVVVDARLDAALAGRLRRAGAQLVQH